jgi:translation initiation factor IF-2
VILDLPCTVRAFSEAIGVPARQVLGKLLTMGTLNTNINAELSADVAELLAVELGVEVDFRRQVALEDKVLTSLDHEDLPEELVPRAPIITFLGHVDHGKTSLLDRIIGIDVASGEKGGITQHIRAYRIERDGRSIAFVDTPGHEAFTEMRARGANVTDIAVLVVAADDGVMPQTEEAISHAKAAGVPIVVALNKIDLPGLNIDRIYQQLATNELLPSEWGGDVEVVKTSATTGKGIDDLIETLLTVAELHEWKANPNRSASGTCLETELHEGRGVVAKLLVQNGTLHVGDVVLCGPAYGRVKAMYNTLDATKRYEEVGPSTPVNVTGLHVPPGAGDKFYVLSDVSQARELAEQRLSQTRQQEISGSRPHVTLENLFDQLGHEENVKTLHIILRADVRGSIEAIRKELTKLEHPEVQIKILQATVGGITEADVHLADASDAVIIGFNVVPDEGARQLAERRGVQIRRYDIIYQVTEDVKAALEGMLKPERRVTELGRALVQRTFHISRIGTVAGCRVMAGTISRDARLRVIRDSRVIGDYSMESLKREKDDTREVREGMECGIKLGGFDDVKESDVLEAYRIEEVARTF